MSSATHKTPITGRLEMLQRIMTGGHGFWSKTPDAAPGNAAGSPALAVRSLDSQSIKVAMVG
jgi:hypothetical protein